jgi:hypothetical protein
MIIVKVGLVIFIVSFIAFIFCLLFISKSGDDYEEQEICDKDSQCVGCPFCGNKNEKN